MFTDGIRKEFARLIDHTLLKPDATTAEVEHLCREAIELGVYAVCVNSSMVETAVDAIAGSQVKVAATTGFPLGASSSGAKARETELAVRAGAHEIDTVVQIGRLKEHNYQAVSQDLADVVSAAGSAIVKVIIEACLLTDEEKRMACVLAVSAGAGFVKTSTGFSKYGATIEDVRLMRVAVGPIVGVKAAGGIRDLRTAVAMLSAGASRLGLSATAAILAETR
ncbi:MAG: deoxyribose-phosphate aldolase [Caldisericota bacterium]|jgi:deoxyribose-phosphate aldolase|nr:deoxyribose-phosphate aldolase [Caldisericota bacterium]